MSNRLTHENSPYLVQHAENPVDWYPWGAEALAKAHREDRPIFLSIGYAACHWCHVMAHESFEDEETAAILNENFVSIKVDREERPDLDSIYMNAVVAMTGSGGWPMSVFLTPQGEPFYGGTYFPAVRRYNMPSFREVLLTITRLWKEDRVRLLESSSELRAHLTQALSPALTADAPDKKILDQAVMRLAQSYDWVNGGWGRAPKFPQPMVIEFLLNRAARGDAMSRDMAAHALQAMARGGMYDVIGGGFARYSTDNEWLTPHFEKMLYDNAQLARVYLHAYLLTGEVGYRRICTQTLDFMLREMRSQENNLSAGGFYSSLDADSEGKEGKFYVWDANEIREILQSAQARVASEGNPISHNWLDVFLHAYAISDSGNFEGRNILQRRLNDEELAQQFNTSVEAILNILDQAHAALYAVRAQRVWPGIDDKVLTAWNALALIALSEAARYLDRSDYLQAAQTNARFLLTNLMDGDVLLRSWRNGKAQHLAYLEDHAGLILGLLALYQSDGNTRWFATARHLAEIILAHFTDPDGGFYDTRDDQEALIVRPKDVQDNATPSGSALAVSALLQLSAYTGNGDWRDMAETMIGFLQKLAGQHPSAFAKWLCALDFSVQPVAEVAIIGQAASSQFASLRQILWEEYRPNVVSALSDYPPSPGSPELLDDRPMIDGQATAYVCTNFVCLQPTTDPAVLRAQLRRRLEE